MDNALIIDLVLLGILAAFALLGARKGLMRSLMALVSTLLALVGAAMLTAALVEPVTDLIFPVVREKTIVYFEQMQPAAAQVPSIETEEDGAENVGSAGLLADMGDALRRFGVSDEAIDGVKQSMTHSAVSAAERAAYLLVKTVVQAGLFLLTFLVLALVLRLLTRALDAVCRLPLLRTINTLGGAALSLAEGALIVYLILYLSPRFGVTWFADHAAGTYLLAWFLSNSPYGLIASLT